MSVEHSDAMFKASLSLFSTLRRNDLIPRDIGLELVPGLPNARAEASTACDDFNQLYYPSAIASLWQNTAFSLAISQDVGTEESGGSLSDLAIGVRTLLFAGRASSALLGLVEKYEELSRTIAAARPGSDEQDRAVFEAFVLRERVRKLIGEAEKSRVGWLWELGGAVVLEVPERRFSRQEAVRRAAWLNPIFRFDGRPVSLAGLVRYIYEPRVDNHIADIGGRVTVRYEGIYYSFEALQRYRSRELAPGDDRENARLVGSIGYGLNSSTQVNLTFGKNYGIDFTNAGSFVASFGITLGLGSVPLGPTR